MGPRWEQYFLEVGYISIEHLRDPLVNRIPKSERVSRMSPVFFGGQYFVASPCRNDPSMYGIYLPTFYSK